MDPQTVVFIDGAILNNRPFQQAISAIHGRPAYRQVDRRLVYIDPHPPEGAMRGPRQVPGFFSTLRGAISDIPSSQPVIDELGWVAQFNDQVRRLRDIVESARPHVRDLVGGVVPDKIEGAVTAAELRAWREQVNDHVARDAGFAYEAYVRLKLASARAAIAETIVKLRGVPVQSPLTRVVGEIVDVWAARKHLKYERNDGAAPQAASAGRLPGWVAFLLAFDVNYRERRLHFLIEGQNRLYQFLDFESFGDLDPLVVDRLKREFYRRLDALRLRESASFYSATTRAMVTDIFPSVPAPSEMRDIEHFANDFVDRHGPAIDRLIDALAAEIDLDATTHELDELLAELDPQAWHAAARREVLVNYLGFPFWDVLTFPVTSAREMGEFNEILVDRISPLEAHALEGFNGVESLKGIGFGHFAAFLSRAYRENDYLLGRLHALDRLIDIVCDSAGDAALAGIDAGALKRRGFAMILTAEESTLTHCAELIAALRRFIGEQSAAGDGPTFN